MALRSRQAFEAETPRIAYAKADALLKRMTPRVSACWRLRRTGWRVRCRSLLKRRMQRQPWYAG